MSHSVYLATALSELVLRGGSYTSPSQLSMGLFDAISGSEIPSGGGYARTNFDMPGRVGGEIGGSYNDQDIVFDTPTDHWGIPYTVRVYDEGSNHLLDGIISGSFGPNLSRFVSNRGSNMLIFSDVPQDGDTVTIGDVVYRFKTTLAAPYDVKIEGSDEFETAMNLKKAINDSEDEGTAYGNGTEAHPDVECPLDEFSNPFDSLEYSSLPTLIITAKVAPGNGMEMAADSDRIWFRYTKTSGGGVPFVIRARAMKIAYGRAGNNGPMDYLTNKLYDLIIGQGSFSAPSGLTVHLYTTAPNFADAGGTELGDAGYAPLPISFDVMNTSTRRSENTSALTFGVAAGTYTVRAAVLRDGSGNPLWLIGMNTQIVAGNQLRFGTSGTSRFRLIWN